jgi:hypothetical protein
LGNLPRLKKVVTVVTPGEGGGNFFDFEPGQLPPKSQQNQGSYHRYHLFIAGQIISASMRNAAVAAS